MRYTCGSTVGNNISQTYHFCRVVLSFNRRALRFPLMLHTLKANDKIVKVKTGRARIIYEPFEENEVRIGGNNWSESKKSDKSENY